MTIRVGTAKDRSVRFVKPVSDDALLQAIATHRNHEAFEEFYRRYQKPAYNLAAQLSFDPMLAEEVVQEAMLAVWQKASSFRAEGKVHSSWFLRTVAQRTFKVVSRRRKRPVVPLVWEREAVAEEAGEDEEPGRAETLAMLRKALGELLEEDRQILALYFGADVSQREIGQTFGLPQTTVSLRIDRALEVLRSTLAHAGFSAALPLLADEGLREAFCSGLEPPMDLRERVLESLTRSAHVPLGAIPWVAIKGFLNQRLLWPATLMLVTTAAGIYWRASDSRPSAPSLPTEAPPLPPEAGPPPASQEPFNRSWDFNVAGQEAEFRITAGSWRHVSHGGSENSGCMETEGDLFSAELAVPIERLPVLVSFQFLYRQPIPKKSHSTMLSWNRCRNLAWFHNLPGSTLREGRYFSWMVAKTYVTENFILNYGTRTHLFATGPESGARLLLSCRGRCSLDNLRVREVPRGEVPDVRPYLRRLEEIEPTGRVGWVILPGVKGGDPGLPVSIHFIGPEESLEQGLKASPYPEDHGLLEDLGGE